MIGSFIEQRRHRNTLIAYMADIFAPVVAPSTLTTWLASLPLSLIVDTWYDGATRAATAIAARIASGGAVGAPIAAAGTRTGLPMLEGWRFDQFGRDALDLVEGRLGFAVQGGKLTMTRTEEAG